jgi:hypothetical protein
MQKFKHGCDGMTAVDNILDQKHVLVMDVGVQVERYTDSAGGFALPDPIGGDRHEIHCVRGCDSPAEINQEGDASTQDADQEEIPIRIVSTDLGAKFSSTFLQGLFVDEDFSEEVFIVLHRS